MELNVAANHLYDESGKGFVTALLASSPCSEHSQTTVGDVRRPYQAK